MMPSFWIKAFEREQDAINFQNGNIYLSSLEKYRIIEGPGADQNESSYSHSGGARTYCNTVLVLCMHDGLVNKSPHGDYLVKISEPQIIFEAIKKILGQYIRCSAFRNVVYIDDNGQPACVIPPEDIPFFKRRKFSADQEYRMCFFLQEFEEAPAESETVKFHFIQVHPGRNSCECSLDFDEWRNRRGESQEYGDDFYIKVELLNIKFKSELLS